MNRVGDVSSSAAVLFTDLVGFTEFTDAEGDLAAVAVLDRQTDIVCRSLSGIDGRIVKELGDGLMIWFSAAGGAVEAAARIQDAMDSEHARFPLGVRMGIHCGEVVARGSDFVGQTVNIASRIADLAGPGELLVSESVLDALDHPYALRFTPVGPTRVKGVQAPVWLHRFSEEAPVG